MPRESMKRKRERAAEIVRRLGELYPGDAPSLDYEDPFTLTIAVLLSAQTTDKQVNKVTPELFRRWPDAAAMAEAEIVDVEEVISSLGFFRTKAKHCVECSRMIVADYGGEVPSTMAALTKLPGVGRKTANIVLNNGFGIVEGIAVDTHVFRVATRLGLTKAPTPLAAEQDLLSLIPQKDWGPVNHEMVHFGRDVCDAKKPRCSECPLVDLCPSAFKVPSAKERAARSRSKARGGGKGHAQSNAAPRA